MVRCDEGARRADILLVIIAELRKHFIQTLGWASLLVQAGVKHSVHDLK